LYKVLYKPNAVALPLTTSARRRLPEIWSNKQAFSTIRSTPKDLPTPGGPDTMRDKVLRIKQIAKDGVLFQDYEFDEAVQDDIIDFMHANKDRLREVSLRMALKIADLRKMSVLNWKRLAETTCMKVA